MKRLALLFCMLANLSVHAEYELAPCCSSGSFALGAEWIYWKVYGDNFEYAVEVNESTGGGVTVLDERVLAPNFHTSSGYRLFVDYLLCDRRLKFGALFTHLSFNGDNSTNVDPATIATHYIKTTVRNSPILEVTTNPNFKLSSLASQWSAKVNYFDLDMHQAFVLHPCFIITPHMGLRGMWVDLMFGLEGTSEPPLAGPFGTLFTEKYSGVGPEGGVNFDLYLGCGFSLTGHLGGALLYAKIKVDELANIFVGQDLAITLLETSHHLSPMVNGFIGLEYERCFLGHLTNFRLGWEEFLITSINHFAIFNYSSLSMHGLTTSASLVF